MRKQIAERQARLGVAREGVSAQCCLVVPHSAAQGKKSEKQLERAQEQRMEEMIEYTDSEPDDDEEQPKKSALSLKKIRRAKEGSEDPAFKIAGDRSGAERRDKRACLCAPGIGK